MYCNQPYIICICTLSKLLVGSQNLRKRITSFNGFFVCYFYRYIISIVYQTLINRLLILFDRNYIQKTLANERNGIKRPSRILNIINPVI